MLTEKRVSPQLHPPLCRGKHEVGATHAVPSKMVEQPAAGRPLTAPAPRPPPSSAVLLQEPGAKVTVTNVDESLTREQVESHFASYGRVLDVYRQAEHAVVHVQFASAEVALRVVSRTHVINGRKVIVEREVITESPEEEEGWRIYVVCSKYIQEVQLSRFFEEHGEVVKTKMLRDARGGAAGLKCPAGDLGFTQGAAAEARVLCRVRPPTQERSAGRPRASEVSRSPARPRASPPESLPLPTNRQLARLRFRHLPRARLRRARRAALPRGGPQGARAQGDDGRPAQALGPAAVGWHQCGGGRGAGRRRRAGRACCWTAGSRCRQGRGGVGCRPWRGR